MQRLYQMRKRRLPAVLAFILLSLMSPRIRVLEFQAAGFSEGLCAPSVYEYKRACFSAQAWKAMEEMDVRVADNIFK